MDAGAPPAEGFVRIAVRLGTGAAPTPGEIARLCAVELEALGPIQVGPGEAQVDVRADRGRAVRAHLERLGPTRLEGWTWRWLRLSVGRNHGLSMGQLRRVMQNAEALPLGRIHIQNTHSLVGVQDFRLPTVLERLKGTRLNGFALRAEALAPGQGPGSAAFGIEAPRDARA
jgi:hypothetical protein